MVNVSLRHRSKPGPIEPAPRRPANSNRPEPAPGRGNWPYYLVAGLLALAFVGLATGQLIENVRDELAFEGRSADPTPITLTLSDTNLTIPGNMIRFPAQRRPGKVERLDLFMAWPELEGLSARNADIFREISPGAPLIFITLMPGQIEPPITRLEMLYSRLFEGPSWSGPDGLIGRRLAADSAYAGEDLYYQAASVTPFLARCLDENDELVPATCLTEFTIGGVVASYRFDKSLLKDWRQVDAALRSRIQGFFLSGR